MPSVGRKFLMAGRGGLNLTHSEDLERLLGRYGDAAPRLRGAIEALPPAQLRAWAESLGQQTFVGTSGRVFPVAFKASPLLRAWLGRLAALRVSMRTRHHWLGWDGGALRFRTPQGETMIEEADAVVLALGGASWPRLGSDGAWVELMTEAGILVQPLAPANCGVLVAWSAHFRERFEGQPLKRIALSFAATRARGEAVITRNGLEGGAVYALSALVRDALAAEGEATLVIDLRPDLAVSELARRLGGQRGKQSLSTFLRKAAALPPAAIGLLHEVSANTPGRLAAMNAEALASLIKAVPVPITGVTSIERAISTAGGISFSETDETFMLLKRPGVFVAGEMLAWEAPTGGYLLQAAFATGAAAGHGALAWLARRG
jgi:uncharacterized flavoprotein (TIGR03862 family)